MMNPFYEEERENRNQIKGCIERDIYAGGIELNVSHNTLGLKTFSELPRFLAGLKGLKSLNLSHQESKDVPRGMSWSKVS